MTVELTGHGLTLDAVVRVARASERVELSAGAVARMRERRDVVERASREGTPTYGVTTGVGMRRDADVSARDAAAFNRSAISGHLVGLGPPAADESCARRSSVMRTLSPPATRAPGRRLR